MWLVSSSGDLVIKHLSVTPYSTTTLNSSHTHTDYSASPLVCYTGFGGGFGGGGLLGDHNAFFGTGTDMFGGDMFGGYVHIHNT